MTYKYGALPRDFSESSPIFECAIINPRAMPTAPLNTDWTYKVASWPMYKNDVWSDCVVAGGLHALSAITANSGVVPGGAMFSDVEVETVYERICPGFNPVTDVNDNGATLASFCRYGVRHGFTDTNGHLHKLAGWAEISTYTNLDLLKACLYTFGSVFLAANITKAQETQFDSSQPWSWVPGSPIVGGHAFPLEQSALHAPNVLYNEEVITWGRVQKVNRPFMQQQLKEAVVFFTTDWIEVNGVSPSGLDLTQIIADSHNL